MKIFNKITDPWHYDWNKEIREIRGIRIFNMQLKLIENKSKIILQDLNHDSVT